jgi:hypothetical protein
MKSDKAIYTGFEFEMLGYPAIAIINKDLVDPELRGIYNHSVFIDVLPDKYNEFGHPTEEEYDFLNEMEKKIIEYLEDQTSSVHVGHVTTFRKREIIFYTSTPETVEGFLDSFMPLVEREWNAEIEEDAAWQNVGGFYEQL